MAFTITTTTKLINFMIVTKCRCYQAAKKKAAQKRCSSPHPTHDHTNAWSKNHSYSSHLLTIAMIVKTRLRNGFRGFTHFKKIIVCWRLLTPQCKND